MCLFTTSIVPAMKKTYYSQIAVNLPTANTSAFFVFIRVHFWVKDRFRESPLSFVIILAVVIKTFENILLNQPFE